MGPNGGSANESNSPLITRQPCSPLSTKGSIRSMLAGKTPGKGKSKEKLDRFIPNRSALDLDMAHFNLTKENQQNEVSEQQSPGKEEYKKRLAASLNVGDQSRILAFKQKAPAPPEGFESNIASIYSHNLGQAPAKKLSRVIPQTQERILDAPDLIDDYYLNLLDWCCNNVIAIALGGTVYLWNASQGAVEELCQVSSEAEYISSLSWATDGTHLAVGTSDCKVQIWDAARKKQLRQLCGHTNRVSSLAWNDTLLSSGGRDSVIQNWDVRLRKDQANVGTLRSHAQEVCGLKWSPSGQQLASGGNDNVLCIWDRQNRLQHRINAHQAAVKALAWCPFQGNLLATGGGTADRCIRFWNTTTGAMLNCVDTGSQVCALQWSRHEREILSSHGFSKNQLCLWKYPSMSKMAEMTGHTARALHMAQSPDGTMVVTAGADETIRFWKCFGDPPSTKTEKPSSSGVSGSIMQKMNIR